MLLGSGRGLGMGGREGHPDEDGPPALCPRAICGHNFSSLPGWVCSTASPSFHSERLYPNPMPQTRLCLD